MNSFKTLSLISVLTASSALFLLPESASARASVFEQGRLSAGENLPSIEINFNVLSTLKTKREEQEAAISRTIEEVEAMGKDVADLEKDLEKAKSLGVKNLITKPRKPKDPDSKLVAQPKKLPVVKKEARKIAEKPATPAPAEEKIEITENAVPEKSVPEKSVPEKSAPEKPAEKIAGVSKSDKERLLEEFKDQWRAEKTRMEDTKKEIEEKQKAIFDEPKKPAEKVAEKVAKPETKPEEKKVAEVTSAQPAPALEEEIAEKKPAKFKETIKFPDEKKMETAEEKKAEPVKENVEISVTAVPAPSPEVVESPSNLDVTAKTEEELKAQSEIVEEKKPSFVFKRIEDMGDDLEREEEPAPAKIADIAEPEDKESEDKKGGFLSRMATLFEGDAKPSAEKDAYVIREKEEVAEASAMPAELPEKAGIEEDGKAQEGETGFMGKIASFFSKEEKQPAENMAEEAPANTIADMPKRLETEEVIAESLPSAGAEKKEVSLLEELFTGQKKSEEKKQELASSSILEAIREDKKPLLPPQPLLPSTLEGKKKEVDAAGVVAELIEEKPKAREEVASLKLPRQIETFSPDVSVGISFKSEEIDLNQEAKQQLDRVIGELESDPIKRINIISYASSPDGQSSTARRISLKRALAVRKYCIDGGLDSTRINVQAMGKSPKEGDEDRVDILFIGKS